MQQYCCAFFLLQEQHLSDSGALLHRLFWLPKPCCRRHSACVVNRRLLNAYFVRQAYRRSPFDDRSALYLRAARRVLLFSPAMHCALERTWLTPVCSRGSLTFFFVRVRVAITLCSCCGFGGGGGTGWSAVRWAVDGGLPLREKGPRVHAAPDEPLRRYVPGLARHDRQPGEGEFSTH